MLKYDGHIHTPFCPHGTKDELNRYCEQAIKEGLSGITFTEHAPLPENFVDPAPTQDSAMPKSQLYQYIEQVQAVRTQYKDQLTVGVGLEVDFIEGYEKEVTTLLNEVGPMLTDSILSVHFLKVQNQYMCMDFSPELFQEIADLLGSVDAAHQLYYETVHKSVQADLGPYKPKRVGHITLANKFQKRVQPTRSFAKEIDQLLLAIKERGYALDYNLAGLRKPLCKESYPPYDVAVQAASMEIPLIFGSDSHQAKEVSIAWSEYNGIQLSTP
ncbi:histidinol-phosphatase HisJ [Alkalihalobacillus sp. FSL W8-0930]